MVLNGCVVYDTYNRDLNLPSQKWHLDFCHKNWALLVAWCLCSVMCFLIRDVVMQLVPKEVVAAFPRAMLNIHPGLLPAFGGKGYYGSRVHKAVIKSGARFTGPTVHFVDEDYDTGPILAQRVVPVLPLEDHKQLAARVLKEVCCLLVFPITDDNKWML